MKVVGGLGGVDDEVGVRFDVAGDEEGGGAVGTVMLDAGVSDVTGDSLAGGGVAGAFGLQPRSRATIKIIATKILRFILTPAIIGHSHRRCQPSNLILC